jgi:tetratricopeptide (TPR) repeat protein
MRRIWGRQGDAALKAGDLEGAFEAYRLAELPDKIARVELEMRRQGLVASLQQLQQRKEAGEYQKALDMVKELINEYPDLRFWSKIKDEVYTSAVKAGRQKLMTLEQEKDYAQALALVQEMAEAYPEHDWDADLERIKDKTLLPDLYQQAIQAQRRRDLDTAKTLLAQVVSIEPEYAVGDAARRLHQIVIGKRMLPKWLTPKTLLLAIVGVITSAIAVGVISALIVLILTWIIPML